MALVDINLIGKRYLELTETVSIEENTLFSVYQIGNPENNKLEFINLQKNISIKNLKDLAEEDLEEGDLLKWSISLDRFYPGKLEVNDIPNLPADKITSGTFVIERIPDLSISKIVNLQQELDGKENSFQKGNIVSSTLVLSNQNGRLYGGDDLSIDIDIPNLVTIIKNEISATTNGFEQVVGGDDEVKFDGALRKYIKFIGVGGVDISYIESENTVVIDTAAISSSGLLIKKERFGPWQEGDPYEFTLSKNATEIHDVVINRGGESDYSHVPNSNVVTVNEELEDGDYITIYYFIFNVVPPSDLGIFDETFDETFE